MNGSRAEATDEHTGPLAGVRPGVRATIRVAARTIRQTSRTRSSPFIADSWAQFLTIIQLGLVAASGNDIRQPDVSQFAQSGTSQT